MNDAPTDLVHHNVIDEVLVLTPQVEQMRETDDCYAIRDGMAHYAQSVPHRCLVIDMNKVNFVSSTGILAFLNLRRCVPNPDERIMFCNLSEDLEGMFRICKMISDDPSSPSPFRHADSLESAISSA
ncbi:anti-sigma factor antagonist [Bremerella cremea]|uniref:Anti-sigma factor antagonist n=1 Tax=Bremerella cremea TaxID=1031537 RepID=A0A368KJN7_9BACT|nr:STAS domain-containing protein [Bremerella cremea]RCS40782.1 anti-sigma factor antagonist [Bremerella cremea]